MATKIKAGDWVGMEQFPGAGMVASVSGDRAYVDSERSASWLPLTSLTRIPFSKAGFSRQSEAEMRKLHGIK